MTDSALDADDAAALVACQADILELIATGAAQRSLLDRLTSCLEELIPGGMCSILLYDVTANVLRHGSAPNLPAEFLLAIDNLSPGPAAGSCGTAVFTGQPVIVEDISTDERWVMWREPAAAAGLGACWSTPIRGGSGAVVGSFAVYHAQPQGPTDREYGLVEKLSFLASVAIEHSTLFTALTDNEERFRRAFEDNAVAIALYDNETPFSRKATLAVGDLSKDATRRIAYTDVVEELARQRWAAVLDDVRADRRGRPGADPAGDRPVASGSDGLSSAPDGRLARPDGDRAGRNDAGHATAAGQMAGAGQAVGAWAAAGPGHAAGADDGARPGEVDDDAEEANTVRRDAELARLAAEAAGQAKSEFLSAVSHEMRLPLEAITGFAQILDDLDLDPTGRRNALRHIAEGAQDLLNIVDGSGVRKAQGERGTAGPADSQPVDPADASTGSGGLLSAQAEPVRLPDLMNDVLDFLAPVANRERVRFERGPARGAVRVEHRRLRQLLINLVSAGIRSTGSGSVVRVTSTIDPDDGVTLTVSTPGAGAGAGRPGSAVVPGVGDPIGLEIARAQAEALGGRLVVDGQAGLHVSVRLPSGSSPASGEKVN